MIQTLKHLAFTLKVPVEEFQMIISNIDYYYYEKTEFKYGKDGTPKIKNGTHQKRVLYPSLNRLKIIQTRILKRILNDIPVPDYAFGAVKGRDNVKNAKRHQGKKFIFTTDLRKFYPSVDHHKVFEMLRRLKFSPTAARVLTQLTTYKGQLPQGAPTSPAMANLVFIKTGDKLKEFASKNMLTFTSYIDDLTFSSATDFKNLGQHVISVISDDGFSISNDKTNYKTKSPSVTGIIVKNNYLTLPASFKDKLKNVKGKTPEQINGLLLYANKVLKSNLP